MSLCFCIVCNANHFVQKRWRDTVEANDNVQKICKPRWSYLTAHLCLERNSSIRTPEVWKKTWFVPQWLPLDKSTNLHYLIDSLFNLKVCPVFTGLSPDTLSPWPNRPSHFSWLQWGDIWPGHWDHQALWGACTQGIGWFCVFVLICINLNSVPPLFNLLKYFLLNIVDRDTIFLWRGGKCK